MTGKHVTVLVALLLVAVTTGAARADDEERNKQIVRTMVEAINARDFAALDGVVAADVRRHSAATAGVDVRNREQFKEFLRQDLTGVPDAHQEIVSMIAEDDTVALRALYRGTQTGPMGPFPPSGKAMEIPFLAFLRIADDKIAEMWVEWDNLAAFSKLGLLPPPEALAATPSNDRVEAHKALARRWFEDVINGRNLDAVDETYAADYVHHGPEGAEMRGLDQARAFAAAILDASADRRATVEEQIVEGDRVVTRFTSRGTQTGPFLGRPATGEPWTTEGIVISRIRNGKIVEDWEITHQSGSR